VKNQHFFPFLRKFIPFSQIKYIFVARMYFGGKMSFGRACGASSLKFSILRNMIIMSEFFPLGFEWRCS